MTDADMRVIARMTRHVSGLPVAAGAAGGNPGPSTAYGVLLGLKAAVRHRLGRNDVRGLRVAIQGVGSVGGDLARALAASATCCCSASASSPSGSGSIRTSRSEEHTSELQSLMRLSYAVFCLKNKKT